MNAALQILALHARLQDACLRLARRGETENSTGEPWVLDKLMGYEITIDRASSGLECSASYFHSRMCREFCVHFTVSAEAAVREMDRTAL